MKNRFSFLILSFIVLILSLNVLSAAVADTNTDNTTLEQHQLTKNILSSDNQTKTATNNIIYVNSKSKSTKEDGTKDSPYKTINEKNLDKISDNSTIYVSTGTYNLKATNINKNISIVGENQDKVIFTSKDKASVFTISKDSTVTFKDFTLKNFSSDTNAAITNNGNLIIENLNLLNNVGTTRSNQGGSILNNGNLEVFDSNFENNTASWGGAIYNTKNAKVYNSKFKDNYIYNVGGAIYSVRGNLTVYNSRFTQNVAVSGAAIYNAAGYMYVNNTEFYKNDAEKFFGGAIYSTGITVTNNSQFYLNHAAKDGGAITNTNNFTINNCVFEQNSADENGGAIENVPWSNTENGNLTIINSSFIENSAVNYGGVIINYHKVEHTGKFATITARKCIFESNSASIGGVIYNQEYMDFQNSVFVYNTAEKYNVIYSAVKNIKSADNNWWGINKPKKSDIGVTPKTWVVMNFTNTTSLLTNMTSKLQISLNRLNTGKLIDFTLPERIAVISADKTVIPNQYITMGNPAKFSVTPLGDKISVQIDNQILSLKPVKTNITYGLTNNNQTLQIKFNLPDDINGKTSVKINSITIFDKIKFTKGSLTLNYDIPTVWSSSKYNLAIYVLTNDNRSFKNTGLILSIPKRVVTAKLTVVNTTSIKAGSTIKLVANIKLGNKTVSTGRVAFKVNNITIKTNLKLVNGEVVLTYKIPTSFSPKNYAFSLVYSGDNNKYSTTTAKQVKIQKQDVHTTLKDKMVLSKNTNNKITVKLLDENNKYVTSGKACYKINGKTVETNITVTNGVFTFVYKTPNYSKAVKQTLTIKFGETSKYNSFAKDIELTIQ